MDISVAEYKLTISRVEKIHDLALRYTALYCEFCESMTTDYDLTVEDLRNDSVHVRWSYYYHGANWSDVIKIPIAVLLAEDTWIPHIRTEAKAAEKNKMEIKGKGVLHYFIEVDDSLRERQVGTSRAANGLRALILFADRRYDHWVWQRDYIVASDGRCLTVSCFPPAD